MVTTGSWKKACAGVAVLACVFVVGAGAVACTAPASGATTAQSATVATVVRGNLSDDITSAGNLALSVTADPAFEVAGTVSEVLVDLADSVKKGQVLARLDAAEWQTRLDTLANQVTSAQRTLTSRQRSVTSSQISLINAKKALEQAREPTSTGLGAGVASMLDPIDIQIKTMQVDIAQWNLDDAKTAVTDAQRSLDTAQKAYDDAKASSIEVVAPFDGFITKLGVTGGQQVLKGAVAVTMADPTKFQAQLNVGEMDIFKIAIGTSATVGIDAVSGLSVPAKVTWIAPTATVSGNVVSYSVKVELDSTRTQQLKQGLSVTVTLNIASRQNVLMVPVRAIVRQQGNTFVQVPDGGATPKLVPVTVGMSTAQFAEIVSGLKEGDKVMVQASSSSSSSSQQRPGGMGIPGVRIG